MLKLRKILLLDYIYFIFFFIVIILTSIRLLIPKTSNYNINTNQVIGIVTNIKEKDKKVTITIKAKEKLLMTYYKNKLNINLNLGDKIKVTGELKEPKNQKTKNLFNYKKYLYRQNIFYTITPIKIEILSKNKNIYYYLKQKIINRFNENAYLNTFIIGDKNYIDSNIKKSYQENGISHLFAISGMHITLLVSIIDKILLRLKIKEYIRFKITIFILIIYLLLVGLSPSILRGVLFYFLFKLNNLYYFYIKPVNLFIIIFSISLLINPNYIYDVGFQYSYLISLSLICLSKELKSNNYFISLLKVSIISFIVSIPITLYNFNQINIMSIFYNLIFVPLISIIIFPFTLIVFIIKPLEPIYNLLILVLENLSLYLSKILFGKLVFYKLSYIIYLIYFLLILLYIFRTKKEYIILLFIFLNMHYFYPFIKNETYINFIDVGQGDSILIHKDNKSILIDTGGSLTNKGNISNNTIIPLLKSYGINKIEYLILTHGDYDHMGEAINLVDNFKVEKVIFNCGPYNDLEQELIKVLDKKKIKYYSCIKELNIDNNKLYFLQIKEYDNENDNSNVIYTELNGYKFMFMGDAGIEKEKDILEKYNISNIDVLKVGHHGSNTSSSKIFIDEINPKYSIISVGKNNRYGHPNKEALDNLKNSKIYRTDQDGSIMFKIKNNKLKINTCSP